MLLTYSGTECKVVIGSEISEANGLRSGEHSEERHNHTNAVERPSLDRHPASCFGSSLCGGQRRRVKGSITR